MLQFPGWAIAIVFDSAKALKAFENPFKVAIWREIHHSNLAKLMNKPIWGEFVKHPYFRMVCLGKALGQRKWKRRPQPESNLDQDGQMQRAFFIDIWSCQELQLCFSNFKEFCIVLVLLYDCRIVFSVWVSHSPELGRPRPGCVSHFGSAPLTRCVKRFAKKSGQKSQSGLESWKRNRLLLAMLPCCFASILYGSATQLCCKGIVSHHGILCAKSWGRWKKPPTLQRKLLSTNAKPWSSGRKDEPFEARDQKEVETEDMMAKMKAETGMGMKMYKREAWCWVLLAFGCDRCWYDVMQDLMHMSEGDMETMAAREAGNGCTPFFRCCLLEGASSRNLSKFSWVFNHEP